METKIISTASGTIRDEAMAFLDSKELIIPNNAIGKTMTLAHEIAHNFGVQHTFDVSGTLQKGDVKLKQQQTLENIMDYPKNGDVDRRDFITYQWNKMREKIVFRVNTISDLSIEKNPDPSRKWLMDYCYSDNLRSFTERLLDWLARALEKKHNGDLSEIKNSSDKILTIFANEITKILNKI